MKQGKGGSLFSLVMAIVAVVVADVHDERKDTDVNAPLPRHRLRHLSVVNRAVMCCGFGHAVCLSSTGT